MLSVKVRATFSFLGRGRAKCLSLDAENIHVLHIFFISEWLQHLTLKHVCDIDVVKHLVIVLPIHIHFGGFEEWHKFCAKEEVGV